VASFAAAVSAHPDAAVAAAEVAGQVLEQLDDLADLACLFVTEAHVDAFAHIAAVVRQAVRPGVLLGASACSVLAGGTEVELRPGIALWAGLVAGRVVPVQLTAETTGAGWQLAGLPDDCDVAGHLLLLADPFTYPVGAFLQQLAHDRPRLSVIGGMASAGRSAGGNRLVLDDHVTSQGAVGVLLEPEALTATVVSQGCRPIGQPWTVTGSERNLLLELGGRPALERVLAEVDALSPDDRNLAARGLHCGIVVNEHQLDFERGDFLVRGVLGADRERGALAVGEEVPVGATVQLHVRDADSADEDLTMLMADATGDGALVFTCNGRGEALFGRPHHDAEVVSDLLGTTAVGGMFCAGELGPIGGRNAIHGFTAAVAVFAARPS
jgi:small ligand-binding sensory domain FIST